MHAWDQLRTTGGRVVFFAALGASLWAIGIAVCRRVREDLVTETLEHDAGWAITLDYEGWHLWAGKRHVWWIRKSTGM